MASNGFGRTLTVDRWGKGAACSEQAVSSERAVSLWESQEIQKVPRGPWEKREIIHVESQAALVTTPNVYTPGARRGSPGNSD